MRCADASWSSAGPRCSPSSPSTSPARRSPASDFADLRVDAAAGLQDDDEGVVVATIVDERSGLRAEVPLVRYHDWAERGPSQMRVWVPVVGA